MFSHLFGGGEGTGIAHAIRHAFPQWQGVNGPEQSIIICKISKVNFHCPTQRHASRPGHQLKAFQATYIATLKDKASLLACVCDMSWKSNSTSCHSPHVASLELWIRGLRPRRHSSPCCASLCWASACDPA